MSILGDWVRDKLGKDCDYGPLPEVLIPSVVPDEDDYECLIVSSKEARIREINSDITVFCSTAMEDYPIYPVSELKYEPLAEWVCQWCGNMYPSDVHSCEKCGGPKKEIE
jgi:hypothetical protein